MRLVRGVSRYPPERTYALSTRTMPISERMKRANCMSESVYRSAPLAGQPPCGGVVQRALVLRARYRPYTHAPMQTLTLGAPGSDDASAVGNKAANLARLAAHFRVPPGFCIDDIGARQRSAPRPPRTAPSAASCGRSWRPGYRVARRSGPALRSPGRGPLIGHRRGRRRVSFAGQHETILNVRGVEAVTDAVLECWRSAASERATAIGRRAGSRAPARIACSSSRWCRRTSRRSPSASTRSRRTATSSSSTRRGPRRPDRFGRGHAGSLRRRKEDRSDVRRTPGRWRAQR